MIKEIQFSIPASDYHDELLFKKAIAAQAGIPISQAFEVEIRKKSLDARSRVIKYNLLVRILINEAPQDFSTMGFKATQVHHSPEVHIIGAGPAGLFCVLQCIVLGLKPIVIERGKNVKDRRRDLALLNKEGILNEESNYCFGEGGGRHL